ncbi:hypothetical protein [Bacillus sp. FJAT-45037]|uniref:hypothetical protein n=1 Tax=Bacillus sp. FJAT-45037 TaxID=2011007 RepID=UPI000C23B441|nr:hypothetical protein [Bacillus sp. FJAT-45037]
MGIKGTIFTTVVAGVASAATVILSDNERRERTKRKVKEMYSNMTKNKASQTNQDPSLEIGHPDPYDVEDNKMVGEGALYSVQHYNKKQ